MMKIEVSVDINRPPEVVWAVLTEVERWPEWTASVTAVERLDQSAFGLGSRVRIRQPKLKPMVWRVSEFEPARMFSWETHAIGIFVVGRHSIVRNDRGGTTVTLGVDQKGWLALLLNPFTSNLTRRYVEIEARGLKNRCEEFGGLR
jgi:uncharacterized protein YndB with AHSA1/START domain